MLWLHKSNIHTFIKTFKDEKPKFNETKNIINIINNTINKIIMKKFIKYFIIILELMLLLNKRWWINLNWMIIKILINLLK